MKRFSMRPVLPVLVPVIGLLLFLTDNAKPVRNALELIQTTEYREAGHQGASTRSPAGWARTLGTRPGLEHVIPTSADANRLEYPGRQEPTQTFMTDLETEEPVARNSVRQTWQQAASNRGNQTRRPQPPYPHFQSPDGVPSGQEFQIPGLHEGMSEEEMMEALLSNPQAQAAMMESPEFQQIRQEAKRSLIDRETLNNPEAVRQLLTTFLGFEECKITTEDNKGVDCLYRRVENPRYNVVFHRGIELSSKKENSADLIYMLPDDCNVLFLAGATQGSRPSPLSSKFGIKNYLDTVAAIEKIHGDNPTVPLICVGKCQGSFDLSRALIEKGKMWAHQMNIKGIIFESLFTSITEVAKQLPGNSLRQWLLRRWRREKRPSISQNLLFKLATFIPKLLTDGTARLLAWATVKKNQQITDIASRFGTLGGYNIPALFIHCEDDHLSPLGPAIKAYEALKSGHTNHGLSAITNFWKIPAGKTSHCRAGIDMPQDYKTKLNQFVEAALEHSSHHNGILTCHALPRNQTPDAQPSRPRQRRVRFEDSFAHGSPSKYPTHSTTPNPMAARVATMPGSAVPTRMTRFDSRQACDHRAQTGLYEELHGRLTQLARDPLIERALANFGINPAAYLDQDPRSAIENFANDLNQNPAAKDLLSGFLDGLQPEDMVAYPELALSRLNRWACRS